MTPLANAERDKNHRFPVEIISHGVWLSYRFTLSYRDGQELLCARGLTVSHEAIRQWCRKFGQEYANRLRRRRPRPGEKWYLDDVCLPINGERHYLWRAVDQADNVLDSLVPSRRHQHAAKRFCRTLLQGFTSVPRVLIPETRQSSGAATRERRPGGDPRPRRSLQNRWEPAHRPRRQRARRLPGFTSPGPAQRFLSASGPMAQPFRPRRHVLAAVADREARRRRGERWAERTGTKRAASRRDQTGVEPPFAS